MVIINLLKMNKSLFFGSSFLLLASTALVAAKGAPVDFLPQGLDEFDINIDYNVDLKCAACIRGGYFFCKTHFMTKCC
jgi:hypothetical protein